MRGNGDSGSVNPGGLLLGMQEMGALLERWRLDEAEVRRRMYRAPTPRERERWHTVWLLARGLDGRGGGGGAGTRCPYDWPMGPGIRGGRPQGAGF